MSFSSKDPFEKAKTEIIARAWSDEKFKKRLLGHPKEVLKEYGFSVPSSIEVEILENTSKKAYFVLPIKMDPNLSKEELKKTTAASAGFCCS